jgi:hypothetical protein
MDLNVETGHKNYRILRVSDDEGGKIDLKVPISTAFAHPRYQQSSSLPQKCGNLWLLEILDIHPMTLSFVPLIL